MQKKITSIDLKTLIEAARSAVDGDLSTERTAHVALTELLQVGTSAGGARAKAVVAWNRDTDELRAGNLGHVDGFEQWLLKFDGVGKRTSQSTGQEWGDPQGHTRIERAYYLMAVEAGLTVPQTRLLEENGRAHFMIRRFDRTSSDARLHMQTLCGLTGLDFNVLPDEHGNGHRYEDLFDTMVKMGLDDEATMIEALRRMVFNVLASNNDDHTKNHAFLMNAVGSWSLAPAYDLTFSYRPDSEWVSRHLMSVGGKREGITRADVFDLADRYAIPGAGSIIKDVSRAVQRWRAHADAAGVSATQVDEVEQRLESVGRDFYQRE